MWVKFYVEWVFFIVLMLVEEDLEVSWMILSDLELRYFERWEFESVMKSEEGEKGCGTFLIKYHLDMLLRK